jgi:hypothetical protein
MAKKKNKGMKPKREKRTPMILVENGYKSGKKGRKR